MENETNPYKAPESDLSTSSGQGHELTAPRSVGAGQGVAWIGEGFNMFKENIGVWIGVTIVFFLIFFVLGLIPLIGPLATYVLAPILLGGIMLGCYDQDKGDGFTFNHLFAGFSKNAGQLALVGVIYAVLLIVAMIPMFLTMGAVFGSIMAGTASPEAEAQAIQNLNWGSFAIGGLVTFVLSVLVGFAYWLAPALVAIHDMNAIEAMKTSFKASLKNVLPLIIFGLIMFILSVIGMIPLFLGLLVVVPMGIAGQYAAYKDILVK